MHRKVKGFAKKEHWVGFLAIAWFRCRPALAGVFSKSHLPAIAQRPLRFASFRSLTSQLLPSASCVSHFAFILNEMQNNFA